MKKLISLLAVFILCITAVGCSAERQVTLYSESGQEVTVNESEVEAYLAIGWKDSWAAVTTQMYDADGVKRVVFIAYIPEKLAQGWTMEAPVVTPSPTAELVVTSTQAPIETPTPEPTAEPTATPTPEPTPAPTPDFSRKLVALSFDDGPGYYTQRIVDALVASDSKATFFVLGIEVVNYGKQLRYAVEKGMEIGSHGNAHINLKKATDEEIINDVQTANQRIFDAAGVTPQYFRVPYGAFDQRVREKVDMIMVNWTVDSLDWELKNADAIVEKVMDEVFDGSIILLHEIYGFTAEAVEKLIPLLKAQGYELVTVSELASARGVNMQKQTVYRDFSKSGLG